MSRTGPMTVTVTPRDGPTATLICLPVPCEPNVPDGADILNYCIRSRRGTPFREKQYAGTLIEAVVQLAEVGWDRFDLVALARVEEPAHDVEARWHRGALAWEPWRPVLADAQGVGGDDGVEVTSERAAELLIRCSAAMQEVLDVCDQDKFDMTPARDDLREPTKAAREYAAAILAASRLS